MVENIEYINIINDLITETQNYQKGSIGFDVLTRFDLLELLPEIFMFSIDNSQHPGSRQLLRFPISS